MRRRVTALRNQKIEGGNQNCCNFGSAFIALHFVNKKAAKE
ncbi:hypothetical protein [Staphylococcus pseudintermedius]